MNFVLHGHAVSGGITIGYAHLVTTARLEVVHYEIAEDAVEAEVRRFDAALQKDYTLSMGMILVYTTLLFAMNTLVDVSYAVIDPRVRLR